MRGSEFIVVFPGGRRVARALAAVLLASLLVAVAAQPAAAKVLPDGYGARSLDPAEILAGLPQVRNPEIGLVPDVPDPARLAEAPPSPALKRLPALPQSVMGGAVGAGPAAPGQGDGRDPGTTNYFSEQTAIVGGRLSLQATDLRLRGLGPDIEFTRIYRASAAGEPGSLGYGWDFNLNRYLRMYAGLAVTEHGGDGTRHTYNLVKDNPGAFAENGFDGDPLVYYPLDQGHYVPSNPANTNELRRRGPLDWTVRRKDGTIYEYPGYRAPWRGQPGYEGRLKRIVDANGNALTFAYVYAEIAAGGRNGVTYL